MMAKKLSELSQQGKPQKKKHKSITSTEEHTDEIESLKKLADENIDFSDIPELNFDKLDKPIIGKFYRPIKTPISIRIDADVLAWFKAHSHYQRLINKACRSYMIQHLKQVK